MDSPLIYTFLYNTLTVEPIVNLFVPIMPPVGFVLEGVFELTSTPDFQV